MLDPLVYFKRQRYKRLVIVLTQRRHQIIIDRILKNSYNGISIQMQSHGGNGERR